MKMLTIQKTLFINIVYALRNACRYFILAVALLALTGKIFVPLGPRTSGLLQLENKSESHSLVSNSLQPHGLQPARLLSPWNFFRSECWSGQPFSSPGDLPNPGIEPRSPTLQADSLPSEPSGKSLIINNFKINV